MNNLARFVVARPIYGWLLGLACFLGGLHGIENIGRLEDPDYPVQWAYVITAYPGASAEEVELEVTERIEDALQELPHLKQLVSKSVPGRSEIRVELLEEFGTDETPQIFDELRRRVLEAENSLPPGAQPPLVEDDFGDIYGILYAFTARGYSAGEIHDMAKLIAKRLKQVPKVAKVASHGVPAEAVYLELEQARLAQLGFSVDDLAAGLQMENQVVSAGSALFDGRRLRIAQPNAFSSVAALQSMKVGVPGGTEILRLGDLTTIKRTLVEVPPEVVRMNGESVFTIGVSITPGENVVAVGRAVEAEMRALLNDLPLGVEMTPVFRQHVVVDEAIGTFLKNLAISVATVIFALMLFMGWRPGLVVGLALLLTVLGTIEIMYLLSIELQRISLGALMITMGMLVDNGIVIAEGMMVGVRRGQRPEAAAVASVARTQYPLLGATVIGILAFAPISLSDDVSGHFLISLFQVVSISLLLSWLLAVTIIPLAGTYLFKPSAPVSEMALYSAWYFAPYRWLISFGLRRAWLTTWIILAITAGCLYAMQFVKASFFPTNNAPIFYVDYYLQEGTDITTTAADLEPIEQQLLGLEGIEAVTSFIGRGSPRFTAVLVPKQPNPAYANLVIRVSDLTQLNEQMQRVKRLLAGERPDAEVRVSRAEFTTGDGSKIEMRYSGPDPKVLRRLAEQALSIYLRHDLQDRSTDWRPQSLELLPRFDETKARLAGVSRNDVARSLAYNSLGIQIGLLRDGDKLIPIFARAPDAERADLQGLRDRQVWSATQRQYIPISQVVSEFVLLPENTTIRRRDRVRTITAKANQPPGYNANDYFERVRPEVEAIPLPPGYTREWGGEHEANEEANKALGKRIPHAFGIMFFVTILMFGALRQPVVIWLTLPMIVCGVAIGLLVTGLPLTFPSLLGVLSLSGMLIKNCIVLVDEIDKRLAEGPKSIGTMMMASLSRLRPVTLAALTTVFGMSPLLTDAFFREMAVCIMSGLLFATLLTLVAVPVFYRIALGRRLAGG